jgi:hypothetical protein
MRTKTKRIQLRIELALATEDDPRPSRRRQLLAPPADATPGRERPSLLAPVREVSARLAAEGTRSG